MKVLRVISSMNPAMGGPPQGLRNLIPAISQLGVENEVLCSDAPDQVYGRSDSFAVHRVGPASGSWDYCRPLSTWLDKNIARFDAVIAHGLWLYHGYAAMNAVKRFRKANPSSSLRFYVMPHGMLDPWFQRDSSRRIKAWRNSIYWHLIEKRIVSYADGVLFTCQGELECAKESFAGYRPKREMNVSYGVAAPPPENARMQEAFLSHVKSVQSSRYLLYLSRLDAKKGIDILIRAYADLRKLDLAQYPALVVAGPSDSDYAKQMMLLAQKNNVYCDAQSTPLATTQPNVVFSGMLEGDAKWGAFYGCEAFVLPSHQENFGISVVEALACSKPVLITNKINISGEIETDGAALVCEDNLESVYSMLRSWVTMPNETRDKMSRSASNCYNSRYVPVKAAELLVGKLSLNQHSSVR